MPPSELLRMAKGAMDSTEDKTTATCSNHLSFVPENDFVDVVWQNGKALMSNRSRWFQSHCSKPRDNVTNASISKCRKLGTMKYVFGSKEEDDDMVPWLNCPIDESLQHGYGSEFVSGVTGNEVSTHYNLSLAGKRSSVRTLAGAFSGMRPRNQDLVLPSRSSVSMNFPQFSIPAALVKANLQNKVKDKEYAETSPPCQPSEVPQKVSLRPSEEQVSPDAERAEPGVACSSVCSGNSVERPSDGETRDLKRKSRDTEESEWPSEDVEEESMDVKREARGARSKRRRAAEVHNMSERMRRDRINERMRALQELIPNCNKVDKASMLDEAIEYMKTLQLQLQVMSLRTKMSMYAPVPPTPLIGMQHFSMLGMGMNYGSGMDMISGYSGCPMIQVPQMQSAHFSGSPMLGPSANFQMFGPPCP